MDNRYLAAVGRAFRRLLATTVVFAISRAIGIAIFLLRIIIPVLIRMFVQGMWCGAFTLVALCQGLPEHCLRLADTWTKTAIEEYKLTTQFEEMVRNFFEVVAWLVTFTGWVVLSLITVGILWLIF